MGHVIRYIGANLTTQEAFALGRKYHEEHFNLFKSYHYGIDATFWIIYTGVCSEDELTEYAEKSANYRSLSSKDDTR